MEGGGGDYGGSSDYGGGDYGGGSYGLEGGTVGDANAFGLDSSPGFGLGQPGEVGMNSDYGLEGYSYSQPDFAFDNSPVNSYSPDYASMLDNIFGKLPAPARALASMVASRANPALGQALGMYGKAREASKGPSNALGVYGGMVGSAVGTMAGGPLGGVVGGALGGMAGRGMGSGMTGYSGPSAAADPGANGGNMDLLTGGLGLLGTLYANNQNSKGIDNQMRSLQNLYGENSPSAQMFMQQIQRQGAAGGRRTSGNAADASGLTPNQVQLQALLAQNASRLAPSIAQMQMQRNAQRNQTLAQLAGLYQQMGGMQGIRGGLESLFGGSPFSSFDTSGMGIQDMGTGTENYFDPVYGG